MTQNKDYNNYIESEARELFLEILAESISKKEGGIKNAG